MVFLLILCLPFSIEFLRRPPVDKSSDLVKSVVNANKTKRLRSYLETGCIKTHDSVQNISKCKFKDLDSYLRLSFVSTNLTLWYGFHFSHVVLYLFNLFLFLVLIVLVWFHLTYFIAKFVCRSAYMSCGTSRLFK